MPMEILRRRRVFELFSYIICFCVVVIDVNTDTGKRFIVTATLFWSKLRTHHPTVTWAFFFSFFSASHCLFYYPFFPLLSTEGLYGGFRERKGSVGGAWDTGVNLFLID